MAKTAGRNKRNKGKNDFSSDTNCQHEGYEESLSVESVIPPIYVSSTYGFPSTKASKEAFKEALAGKSLSKLIYSRVNHPNAEIAEDRLKYIEPGSGEAAIFGSGMAAIYSLIMYLISKHISPKFPKGKVIAYSSPLYGGTYHLLANWLPLLGYKTMELPADTEEAKKKIIRLGENLGVLYLETPANPTQKIVDIEKLCHAAWLADSGSFTVLDNTFLGIFQNGFEITKKLDFVVYSCTKFIGGHSDVLAGLVIGRAGRDHYIKELKSLRILFGNILHPFESSQIISHLRTYKSRMKRQAEKATYIAKYFNDLQHPKIKKILHPSLFKEGTEQYDIYKKQCTGGGSIISLWLNTGFRGTSRFLDNIKQSKIISLAVSLGGVESLACHPGVTTHSEMPKDVLQRLGITPNFVRISIGDEDANDLIRVIADGLKAI